MHSTTPAISNNDLRQRLSDSIESLQAQIWCESLNERALMYGMAHGQIAALKMAGLIDHDEHARRLKELGEALRNARAFGRADLILHFVDIADDDRFHVYRRTYEAGPDEVADFATLAEANADCVKRDEGCTVDQPNLVRF